MAEIGLVFRSWAMWFARLSRGRAQRRRRRAQECARELGHAATLMFALCLRAVPYTLCGNRAAAATQAQELVALAEEKGSLFWKAYGMVSQGCVLALTGRASDATEMLISGMRHVFPTKSGGAIAARSGARCTIRSSTFCGETASG
jgi:hypothetical protein